MTANEAIETLKLMQAQVEWDYPMEYSAAIDEGIKALEATSPCDLCVNNPPSSMDGKPCSCCPAEPYKEEE